MIEPHIHVLTLGAGKHVTQAAKAAILADLKALRYIPDEVAISVRSMSRARADVANMDTRFGKLVINKKFTTVDGDVGLPARNPLAMLWVAMLESDRFSEYVISALLIHGPPSIDSPWSIVLYVDEVTCGNPLAVRDDARRKVQGVYWSLYQLGPVALADESCWFEIAAFQTSRTRTFDGGIPHLLDVCLSCFFDEQGHDLRHGAHFVFKGHGALMLSLRVEMLIGDIKALCEAVGAMGVSGALPCFFCRRVLG